ncbi:hypothetical protein B0H21DRAFT_484596 [Amylocystis lapponica]|nr:hypothetical protein B0H21DRAFT_484596 [Amylocystis lapponica]
MSNPTAESVPPTVRAPILAGDKGLPQLSRTVVNAPWYPRAYPIGFTSIHEEDDRNVRIKGFIESESESKVCVCSDTCGTTLLKSSATSWLEVPADDRDFQTGICKYPGSIGLGTPSTIAFPKAFSSTPTVIAWLTSFDVGTSASGRGVWRMKVSTSTVTTTNFTVTLDGLKPDSTIVNAEIVWVAIPSDRSNLASGTCTTADDGVNEMQPGHFTGAVTFATPLKSTPTVFFALNWFEVQNTDGKFDLDLAVPEFAVTPLGLVWTAIGGNESQLLAAGFSFIAVSTY